VLGCLRLAASVIPGRGLNGKKETGRRPSQPSLPRAPYRSLPQTLEPSDDGDMPTEPFVCAECGRHDPGDERGWTVRLDVDDQPVAFLLGVRSEGVRRIADRSSIVATLFLGLPSHP
jgi:hypothetical protein